MGFGWSGHHDSACAAFCFEVANCKAAPEGRQFAEKDLEHSTL